MLFGCRVLLVLWLDLFVYLFLVSTNQAISTASFLGLGSFHYFIPSPPLPSFLTYHILPPFNSQSIFHGYNTVDPMFFFSDLVRLLKGLCCFYLSYIRDMFPGDVKLSVHNDAVAALASGTMGKLHGCVLIAGTGTIAYGFTHDGREARAAGAGPVLGDWGRFVLSCVPPFF